MTQSPAGTKKRFQQALRRAEQQQDKLAMAIAHSGLAHAHWQLNTPDLAQLHAEQAEALTLELEASADDPSQSAETATVLRQIADLFAKLGRVDKAITAYRRALTRFSQSKQSNKLAETFSDLGDLLLTHSDYEQALTALLQGCQLAHARNNHPLLARCYRQLARLYFEQEAYEQAQLYGQKSLKSAQRSGQPSLIADSYNAVAVVQKYLGQIETARQLHQAALQLREQINDPHGIADSYHNLGILDEEAGEYGAAADNYALALALRHEIGDQAGELRSFSVLGTVHLAQSQYDLAIGYFRRALELAQTRGERQIESDLLRELAAVYAAVGNFEQAYQLHQQHAEQQRALFNSDRDERLAAIHAQISAGREQRILEVARSRTAELETRIQQLEAERLLDVEREAQRDTGLVVEKQAAERQVAELQKIKTQIVNLLSHEFRTPLTVIGNATYILERFGKRLSAEKQTDNFERIRNAVETLKALLDDICWIDAATAIETIPNPTPTMVYTLTDQAVAQFSILERDRLNVTVPERDTKIHIDGEMVQQIIFHLVGNGLKFSDASLLNGKAAQPVALKVQNSAETLTITVQDYGIGIPASSIDNVSELFYRAENAHNVRGLGVGLAIVKKLMLALGGTMTIENVIDQQNGSGTHVVVRLPITTPQPVAAAFVEAARQQIFA